MLRKPASQQKLNSPLCNVNVKLVLRASMHSEEVFTTEPANWDLKQGTSQQGFKTRKHEQMVSAMSQAGIFKESCVFDRATNYFQNTSI